MKKLTYFLRSLPLFALVLLTSCNMHGHKLYADGDSDDERQSDTDEDQELDHSLPTDSTWQSFYDEIRILGVKKETAVNFAKIADEQVSLGKPEGWAKLFAYQIVEGKSESEAKIFADSKVGSKAYSAAYCAATAAKKSPKFAQKYSETYQKKRQEGKSHRWANAYASQIARGKSEIYAKAFAKKKKAGKSNDWAFAYANAIHRGKGYNFANKVADAFEEQMNLGKPKRWAKKDAVLIAKGERERDINSQDENGDTDLIKAAREGEVTFASKLINVGASCNIRNELGKTALMEAAEKGHVSIVALFLNADLESVNIQDNKGKTALTWARKGRSKVKKGKKRAYNSIIRMLQGAEADESGIRKIIKENLPSVLPLIKEGAGKLIELAPAAIALV